MYSVAGQRLMTASDFSSTEESSSSCLYLLELDENSPQQDTSCQVKKTHSEIGNQVPLSVSSSNTIQLNRPWQVQCIYSGSSVIRNQVICLFIKQPSTGHIVSGKYM